MNVKFHLGWMQSHEKHFVNVSKIERFTHDELGEVIAISYQETPAKTITEYIEVNDIQSIEILEV